MDEKTEADTKPKEKRFDLSLAQVAGSALAAAVAAFLAGQLGVYGTIIGAGVVSVVATTGGSIFQHLFRRTGEQIKEAAVTTRPRPHRVSVNRSPSTPRPRSAPDASGPAGPTMVLPAFDKEGTEGDDAVTSAVVREQDPATARTQLMPRAQQQPSGQDPEATQLMTGPVDRTMALGRAALQGADATVALPQADTTGSPESGITPPDNEETTATYGTRLRGWRRPALGAFAVFVLAMGAVTATELLTGETASGGTGTTLGNLTTGNVSHQRPSTPQAPEPGHSTGSGTGRHDGTPPPDPSRSGGTGSDGTGTGTGTGSGTDQSGQTSTPTPSDGATGSPSPGTSSSPDPSPSRSSGTDGGRGSGGTGTSGGGAPPGNQQGGQNPGGGPTSDPNAP
ncbi:hypothetical protein [Streptomyces sp. NPDC093097]|uniref:hypothetical protein n=1 Tax=Streptomyces sp. NPDC093097 TaxID=3366027 RepID=UPI0038076205